MKRWKESCTTISGRLEPGFWGHFQRWCSWEGFRARYLVSSRRMGLGMFLCHGISRGDEKGREWVIWAGMWRALAIGLDGTRVIGIFEGGDSGTG